MAAKLGNYTPIFYNPNPFLILVCTLYKEIGGMEDARLVGNRATARPGCLLV
jgi:hypothetical protein